MFHHRVQTQRFCGMNKPFFLFLAALLCCGPAAAQQQQPQRIADSGFYYGLDVGSLVLANREEEMGTMIGKEKGGTAEVKQSAGTLLIRPFGGHVINRFVSAEAGLLLTGPVGVHVSGTKSGKDFSEDGSLLFFGFDGSVLLRPYPYPSRPFPYKLLSGLSLRMGGHFMLTSSSVSDYPLGTASGAGLLRGFTFDWPLGEGSFRVGYTRMSDIAGVDGNSARLLSLGYLWRF